MRLTNNLRSAFVRAVMQDVPPPDYKSLQAKAQEAILKSLDKATRAAYRVNPKAIIHGTFYDLDDRISVSLAIGSLSYKEVEEILKEFRKPIYDRKDVRGKLSSIVEGCQTLAQLKKALPELEKYMPKDGQPTPNLPALANVVADLVTLGWQGGQK